MEEVKLPNLAKLKAVRQRLKELPPQKSAIDTSNWDNRNVSAPVIDLVTKKYSTRELKFMRNKMNIQVINDTKNLLNLVQ